MKIEVLTYICIRLLLLNSLCSKICFFYWCADLFNFGLSVCRVVEMNDVGEIVLCFPE